MSAAAHAEQIQKLEALLERIQNNRRAAPPPPSSATVAAVAQSAPEPVSGTGAHAAPRRVSSRPPVRPIGVNTPQPGIPAGAVVTPASMESPVSLDSPSLESPAEPRATPLEQALAKRTSEAQLPDDLDEPEVTIEPLDEELDSDLLATAPLGTSSPLPSPDTPPSLGGVPVPLAPRPTGIQVVRVIRSHRGTTLGELLEQTLSLKVR